MASIQSTIKIFDAYTPIIRNMIKVNENIIDSFSATEKASGRAFNIGSMGAARKALEQVKRDFDGVEKEIQESEKQQEKFNRRIKEGSSASSNLLSTFGKIAGVAITLAGAKKVFDLSDTLTLTNARLNMINDGLQTTAELNDKIFQSAQRSRAGYQDTADMVSKLGMQAKDAFGSNDEVIAFSELLNKSFKIAGADAQAVESVMYNLTQALASGVLRGQDLNAVMSNAPNIIENIANYLDVPVGQIRDMAAEGQLSASVVKNAMLSAAGDINTQFESMPKTIGDVWTSIKNTALREFTPVLQKINEVVNSPEFQEGVQLVVGLLARIASVAVTVFDTIMSAISQAGQFIKSNLQPILVTVAVALAVVAAFAAVAKIAMFLMALKPLLPMLLIIAVIVMIIAAVHGLGYSFEDIFTHIGRVVGVTVASIVNVFIDLWNFLAGFVNAFARIFDDPIAGIMGLFVELGTFILNILTHVAEVIDAIFGTGIASALSGFNDRMTGWYENAFGPSEEFVTKLEHVSADDWGAKGEEFGKKFGAFVDNPDFSAFSLPDLLDGGGAGFDWANMVANVEDIAGNTAKSAKSLEFAEEDIQYLRDIAEREAINRYTLADIRIEQHNENHISSSLDLDGVTDHLNSGLEEAIEIAADGGHN
jgi:tape measure domain-containing protein